MTTSNSKTEAQKLEDYRVAFENVEKQPEIAAALNQIGYDSTVIAEGKQLYTTTRQVFDKNITEDQETRQSKKDMDNKLKALQKMYKEHRKMARVVFRNNDVALRNLGLKEEIPRAFVTWLESFRLFYQTLNSETDMLQQMARLNLIPEDITTALTAIAELEEARSLYLREIGESQDATKLKDAAMKDMERWMSDFYAVAKIALEDRPQLLEALSKLIRS